MSRRIEESFEVSRFGLGLNTEPGMERADRYTLEECLNLDVDDHGALVVRKGCRRVINPSLLTAIATLLVTDVEGVPTFLLSGIHTGDGGSEGAYAARTYSLFGDGLGTGDYAAGTGLYSRAVGLTNDAPRSTNGWQFIYFRGYVYLSAGHVSVELARDRKGPPVDAARGLAAGLAG